MALYRTGGAAVLEDRAAEQEANRTAIKQRNGNHSRSSAPGKILFLGNSYNPLSVACLKVLVESEYETIVGNYDSLSQGRWQIFRKNLKTRGWNLVLHKTARLIRSKTQVFLRRAGVPLPEYASLPEIISARGLKVIRCTDPNSAEFVEQVRRLNVDLIVVAAFGRILKHALISTPRVGCINVHPSLLPQYRGPEPYYWVLSNGETKTGVTVHHLVERIDSGDIILQRELEIRPKDTANDLGNRCAAVAASLLTEAICQLMMGTARRTPQDSSLGSYYSFPPKGVSARPTRSRSHAAASPVLGQKTSSAYAIDPLLDPRWDRLLAQHPRASVFHSIPWLKTLQRAYGFEPVVYTTTPPGAELRNGIVFCRVNSWITGRRLVSLPFSDHCEPLVDSAKDLESILEYLQTERRTRHFKYVELRPTTCDFEDTKSAGGFGKSSQYYLHKICLAPDEEQLIHKFHKNSVQQPIRRAQRERLTYECGQTDAFLNQFYELLVVARRRHHVPPQPKEWFRILRDCMRDAFQIHIASHGGTPVAGVLTLRFKDTVIYKYGGSNQACHRLGSVPFVLAKAILDAKANGAQFFDLGRSDCDNRGLIEFKNHWASTGTLMNCRRFPAPSRINSGTDTRSHKLARLVFESMPDSMLKLAGETLYRHVG